MQLSVIKKVVDEAGERFPKCMVHLYVNIVSAYVTPDGSFNTGHSNSLQPGSDLYQWHVKALVNSRAAQTMSGFTQANFGEFPSEEELQVVISHAVNNLDEKMRRLKADLKTL